MIVLSILDKWVLSFQPLFSRQAAFQWFVLVMFGFLLRTEGEGVTSVIRCLGLASNEYVNLLHFFHSSAFSIVPLCHHWRSLVFQYAPLVLVNNRPVYVVDAIKVGKTGKKMPGVKLLHQESEDNSKAQYIMGHFWGSLCLLCSSCERFAAIPLRLQLQDGLKRSPSEKATLPDKMLRLIRETAAVPGLVVADRYYTCRNVLRGLLDDDFHYIGPVRCSAVAYHPLSPSTAAGPPEYPALVDRVVDVGIVGPSVGVQSVLVSGRVSPAEPTPYEVSDISLEIVGEAWPLDSSNLVFMSASTPLKDSSIFAGYGTVRLL